jgi:hypothetical protein
VIYTLPELLGIRILAERFWVDKMNKVALNACTCIFLVFMGITCGCQETSAKIVTTTVVSTFTISPVPPVTVTITPLTETILPPPVTSTAATTISVYPTPATITKPPVTLTATYTLLSPAATVTVTQYPPPTIIYTTQTSSTIGPIMFLVDSFYSTRNIQIETGKIMHFSFYVSGSAVRYWVLDPNGNPVYIGNNGNFVMGGEGDFLAVAAGSYQFVFGSTFQSGPSIITLYYWST